MHKVLVAEIGSTTTVVNAFGDLEGPNPRFLGQGMAATTVLEGDVNLGLSAAIDDLQAKIGLIGKLGETAFYATSSAAGGLKMTVHGLVPEMTARAAREAALGAGAVVRYQTSGELGLEDWEEILSIQPNILLLAGGVENGDKRVVVENTKRLADWFKDVPWRVPILFAGNSAATPAVRKICTEASLPLKIVPNVYPDIDQLNIEPARWAIQEVFEQHITEAPGMAKLRQFVTGTITPTPGAVMQAARLVYDQVGDVMVFDVGGATTDVHSVTMGTEENQRLALAPEPLAKRTVEGDLGVYLNAQHIADLLGDELSMKYGAGWQEYLKDVPQTVQEIALSQELTAKAVRTGLLRHAGHYRYFYGTSGRITRVEGRDLSRVRWVIGTGGALTRLPAGLQIMTQSVKHPGDALLPGENAAFFLDRDYIMASLGVLAQRFPSGAWLLLQESLGIES